MWETDSTSYAVIKDAELVLLSTPVRGDALRVTSMLAEDFVEIGRSGRRWPRTEIVAALAGEEARPTPATSEWQFNRVSPQLVLVTYRIHGADHDSRHTSLWEIPGPVLRFHQGTVVAD